jgi:hypothetical protein
MGFLYLLQTHTHSLKYLLLSHANYGYANALPCYFICTLLLIQDELTGSAQSSSLLLNLLPTWQFITLLLQPVASVGAARRCELVIH